MQVIIWEHKYETQCSDIGLGAPKKLFGARVVANIPSEMSRTENGVLLFETETDVLDGQIESVGPANEPSN